MKIIDIILNTFYEKDVTTLDSYEYLEVYRKSLEYFTNSLDNDKKSEFDKLCEEELQYLCCWEREITEHVLYFISSIINFSKK